MSFPGANYRQNRPQNSYNAGYGQPQQQGYNAGYAPQQQYGAPPPGPPPGHYQQPYQQQYNNAPQPHYLQNSGGFAPPQYAPTAPPPMQYGNQGYGQPNQGHPQQGGFAYQNMPVHMQPQTQTVQGQQPYYQVSNCTGKRKALCIGINYTGTRSELKGCQNDAINMQQFLVNNYRYKSEDIVMLLDSPRSGPKQIPTKANMVAAMQWLVRGAQPNDSLFFHYSGHGGRTEDIDGDEDDGYDETVYPVDHERAGMLVDDDIHSLLVKPLPAGCRLTAIFDSCHSATAMDLPYVYSTEGKIKEPNLLAEAGQGVMGAATSYLKGDMGGVFKSLSGFAKTAMAGSKGDKLSKQTKTSPADVIGWSGCKDDQTSADTSEAGKATGAMSYAFITSLTHESQNILVTSGLKLILSRPSQYPQQSYLQLLNSIRDILQGKYSQKPQLSSSHPMDTNALFVM